MEDAYTENKDKDTELLLKELDQFHNQVPV